LGKLQLTPHSDPMPTRFIGVALIILCSNPPLEARNRRPFPLGRMLVAARGCCHSPARKLASCGVPNLWKPRADQFFHIDALPYLGTGKLDLRKAREIAATKANTPP
jgi:hypothetical protein